MLELAGSAAIVGIAGCTTASDGGSAPTTTAPDDHSPEDDDNHENTTTEDHPHEDGDHHDETTTHHDQETTAGDHAHHDHHDDHHHEEVPHEPTDHVEVRMLTTEDGAYHFAPHLAWVTPGGTVTWVNESGAHATAAYHPDNGDRPLRIPESASSWDSGLVTEAGATFERTFDEPGVYDYYCEPHEGVGMIATVLVGEPDPHDEPGMADPQPELPTRVREKLASMNGMVDEALGHDH